jgi:hypothetical protein
MILPRLTVSRFGRVIPTSRTKPCIVYSENEEGEEMEFVVKLAAGGNTGIRGLVSEVMATQLANALDLRVPEACLLEITPEFADTVPNAEVAEIMKRSIGWNFGSKKLPPGYSVVTPGRPLLLNFRATAAEMFAFDGMIQNPDRRAVNPNCFTNGSELVILDHEMAFSFLAGVLFWRPPWEGGDLSFLRDHLFFEPLRQSSINFDRLAGAVEALKVERLSIYSDAVPPEWPGGKDAADQILEYLMRLKQNILPTLEAIKTILR